MNKIYVNVLLIFGITIYWYMNNPEKDIKGFNIYYQINNNKIKLLKSINDPYIRQYYDKDFIIKSNTQYKIYVSCYDNNYNESVLSNPFNIEKKISIINKFKKIIWRK